MNNALDALTEIVEEAEAMGLTVVVRQKTVAMGEVPDVVINSFEVYQRLL
jgi:hypothetical protein